MIYTFQENKTYLKNNCQTGTIISIWITLVNFSKTQNNNLYRKFLKTKLKSI